MLGKQRPLCLTAALALCAFLAALSGACKSTNPRTQVMLIIDAEERVRARADKLEVTIESRSELNHIDGVPYTETFPTTEGSSPNWPFSIALLPRGGDARRSYQITAKLYSAEAAIAVLRAHSGFVPQRTLELHLMFTADCLDENSLSCSDQESCLYGACLNAFVDARSLAELGSGARATAADGGMPTSSSAVSSGSQNGADGGMTGAGGMSSPRMRGDAAADAETPPEMLGGDCGDGRVNDDEQCDTAIPQGMTGACPEVCTTVDPCEPLHREGTGCQTRCMGYRIQSAMSGDGCCPAGTDANSDMDCAARCGNGILEADETCDPIDTCPTAGSCAGSNACLSATIEGDAASCTAICVMQPIEACMGGDSCCPANCSHDSDSDCSASCGNGVVDMAAGELCEPGSAELPCAMSCDDGNPCTQDLPTGSAINCNVACAHVAITQTINRDGCCPPDLGNANNDSDCEPRCGNNVVERGEFCDGLCPTQMSQCDDLIPCTRNGLTPSLCGMRCSFEPIVDAANGDSCCPFGANANHDNDCPPECGNSVVERGEVCDGNCPTSCPHDTDNDPCTVNVVGNSGCQRACESRRLTANTGAPDGCCPSGASSSTDSDCGPVCGNMRVETGEMCDPCPTSCMETDADPCTRAVLRGSGCNARCDLDRITATSPGDGCCPPGANMASDSDCTNAPPAVCGNGMTEPGEDCDGRDCPTCDDGEVCTTDMRVDVPDACHPMCRHADVRPSLGVPDGCCPAGEHSGSDSDCTAPPPPMCGNGRVEDGETCDPCPTECPEPSNCMRFVLRGSGCNASCMAMSITAPAPGDRCCPPGENSSTDSDCNNPPPPPDPVCGNGVVESGEVCDPPSDTCLNCRAMVDPPIEPPSP